MKRDRRDWMAALLLQTTCCSSQIPAEHKATLTLYHEYQPKYVSLGLENQDTGDDQGDAYFVLRGLLLPIECAKAHRHFIPSFDCDNPEQNSTQNVVSQHTVEVDDRFGQYGSCTADGSGTYSCNCGQWIYPAPCKAPVGRTDVAQRETGHRIPPDAPPWLLWRMNLAVKTGGK